MYKLLFLSISLLNIIPLTAMEDEQKKRKPDFSLVSNKYDSDNSNENSYENDNEDTMQLFQEETKDDLQMCKNYFLIQLKLLHIANQTQNPHIKALCTMTGEMYSYQQILRQLPSSTNNEQEIGNELIKAICLQYSTELKNILVLQNNMPNTSVVASDNILALIADYPKFKKGILEKAALCTQTTIDDLPTMFNAMNDEE